MIKPTLAVFSLLSLVVLAVSVNGLWVADTEPSTRAATTGTITVKVELIPVDVVVNHILYDDTRGRMYASVPGSQGPLGNDVIAIDRNGDVVASVFVGSDPNALAISADSQFLYVGLDGAGAFRRLALDTMSPDGPLWSLGIDPICNIRTAGDIVVLADNPNAVAIARKRGCWPSHAGVAVFDDGVIRSNVTQDHTGSDVIELSAEPSQLFGYNRETSENGFRTLSVDDHGVTETKVIENLIGVHNRDIRYTDGRVYALSGEVVDADTVSNIGRFVVPDNTLPVIRDGYAFFLSRDQDPLNTNGFRLQVFDASTFQHLTSATVEGLSGFDPHREAEFIAAGPTSMGIRLANGEVYLLNYTIYEHQAFLPLIGRGIWAPGNTINSKIR